MARAFLATVLAATLATAPALSQEPDAKKTVEDVSKQMTDAFVKADTAAAQAILADDWRVVTSAGTVIDKAKLLAALKDGTLKYGGIDKSEVEVRLYGD